MTAVAPTRCREACGTLTGLTIHQAHGETPCHGCLVTGAQQVLEAKLLAELLPVRPTPPHAIRITSEQAANNLRLLNEEMQAFAKAHPAQSWQPMPQRPRRRKLLPCGTPAAARRHRHRNEKLCDPCREAEVLYQKQLRATHAHLARYARTRRDRDAA
ncbi:hypothetical protein ACFWYW_46610 [Nonomuraea sp. NPDC059023]|uniref:hypothetical protein n=1 Tax=unclassified Nonomuraea TaxID=2593643 RepID=UPI00368B7D5E